jgi:hypothetical protein
VLQRGFIANRIETGKGRSCRARRVIAIARNTGDNSVMRILLCVLALGSLNSCGKDNKDKPAQQPAETAPPSVVETAPPSVVEQPPGIVVPTEVSCDQYAEHVYSVYYAAKAAEASEPNKDEKILALRGQCEQQSSVLNACIVSRTSKEALAGCADAECGRSFENLLALAASEDKASADLEAKKKPFLEAVGHLSMGASMVACSCMSASRNLADFKLCVAEDVGINSALASKELGWVMPDIPGLNSWGITKTADPTDGSPIVVANRYSSAHVVTREGKARAELSIRCVKGELDLRFSAGQFIDSSKEADDRGRYSETRIWLDKDGALMRKGYSDGRLKSLSMESPNELAKSFLGHQTLKFEFTPLGYAPLSTVFAIEGVEEVLDQMSACIPPKEKR